MTLEEILAKKDEEGFDLAAELKKWNAAAVAEATTGVNDKNSELLQKLKEAKKAGEGLPEDFTTERWEELLKIEKDVDTAKLKGDEAVEAVKKQMTEAHQKELDTFKTRETKLTSALESQLVDNAVTKAIVEANGNSALLLPHIKQGVKMHQNDEGDFVAIVVDNKGTERFSLTEAGKMMTIAELVGEFKGNDQFKSAFSADSRGGGAGSDDRGGTQKNPWVKGANYSVTEQAKIANQNAELAKTLQTEAKSINEGAGGGQGAS
jgi:hypothetical protein